ncbi:MAG: HDOD domain-containing protein, partial [Myxococcota bacterium]
VETLREAVVRLGARRLRDVLAALAGARLRDATPDLTARVQLRADVVAVAASQIARLRGEDADVAFTAGLLHDLGHAAVHAVCAAPDADLPGDLRDARRAALAARHVHEEVGLHLATRWGLAPSLAAAIGHHHHPAAAGPDAWAPGVVAAALHVADRLGIAPVEPPNGRLEDDPMLARLHLDAGRMSDLCRTVASEVVLLAA